MSKRSVCLSMCWGAALGALGCAEEPIANDEVDWNEEDVSEQKEALYPATTRLWPQDIAIQTCWENGTDANAKERAWVKDQVRRTWESASNVRFSGWGTCSATSFGVRIRIADEQPHTTGLGRELNGASGGVTLNFTYQNWDFPICTYAGRENCIRETAVHEFGHVLGFAHEQNRPDTNRTTCKEPPQGIDGDSSFADWDLSSVMNYCNPDHDNDGVLSPIDEAGVRALYGTRQVANFGYEAGTWRASKHPRLVADVNGDGRDDLVGFGDAGVIVSLAREAGGFELPRQFINAFAYNQGWRVERHVRTLADVNADGRADIVAFGDDGVSLSLSGGTRFYAPTLLGDFGENQGWRVELHVRTLGDVDGDRRPDVVGFGRDGVWVARSQNGSFAAPQFMLADFGENQGWTPEKHVRTLADVNGDGKQDLVGFGTYGVLVALSTGNGFSAPEWFSSDFGYAGGYRVGLHPRFMGDVNRDGRADVVAFASDGVYVALSGSSRFYAAQRVLADMGLDAGWHVDTHPRFVGDVTGDGRADLVGFGAAGVYVSQALGGSAFGPMTPWAVRYSAADNALRNGTALPPSEIVRGLGDFDGDSMLDVYSFRANGFHTTDLTLHLNALPAYQVSGPVADSLDTTGIWY